MLQQARLESTIAISPVLKGIWPQDYKGPVYWMAHKEFTLKAVPTEARMLIAADRHYVIYINGKRAVRQRNFFNGDKYVFAQTWESEIQCCLKAGENTVDIVVRSDPWKNKNHRCYHPFVQMEMTFGWTNDQSHDESSFSQPCGKQLDRLHSQTGSRQLSGDIYCVATDTTWLTAVIEGWREMIAIGGCETIHFENIFLPTAENAILSGFDRNLKYQPAIVSPAGGPVLLHWNDPPARCVIYEPTELAGMGHCIIPSHAVEMKLPEIIPGDGVYNKDAFTVRNSFFDERCKKFTLASSNLFGYLLYFNGKEIFRHESPIRIGGLLTHKSPAYLKPVGIFCTHKGINTFEIKFNGRKNSSADFRICAAGLPEIFREGTWVYSHNGAPVNVKIIELSPSEQMCAMIESEDTSVKCLGASITSATNTGISISGASSLNSLISDNAAGDFDSALFACADMGGTVTGRLSMKIHALSPGKIHLAYGFNYEKGALDCGRGGYNSTDVIYVPKGDSVYEAFDVRTLVYINFVFIDFTGKVDLSDIKIEENVFTETVGNHFSTGNNTIDDLWAASIRNTQLNGNELYTDNPDREHTQWLDGLIYVSTAGYYLDGVNVCRKTRKILEEFMLAQADDGQVPGYAPGKWFPRLPLQCHMSMFVISAHEYFMQSGDREVAAASMGTILKMIEHWERHRDSNGLITDLNTVFVDWGSQIYSYAKIMGSSKEKAPLTGALTTLNAYYLGDLLLTAKTAEFLGMQTEAEYLGKIAGEVKAAMQEKLFNRERGLFMDGYGNPEAEKNISQTANSLAVLFGAAPDGEGGAIMRRLFKLSEEPENNIIKANSFFAWQLCSALFGAGCGDIALSWLKEHFSPMLKHRAGTLWETFDYYHSYAQSNGAALVMLFGKYLAGISPAGPGYSAISIDPYIPDDFYGRNNRDGMTSDGGYWSKGLKAGFRMPAGYIETAIRNDGGVIRYDITLPTGLKDSRLDVKSGIDLCVKYMAYPLESGIET